MRKILSHKKLVIGIFILAGLLVAVLMFTSKRPDPEPKRISMIVYADTAERWDNIREGASLACSTNNAKLNLITMLSEYDPYEQEEIIDREIADGADALIIAPCSSARIREYVDAKRLHIPVVYLESLEDALPTDICIAADDYKMGYELGEKIAEEESDIVTVAILSGNDGRDSVRLREQGLRDAITGKAGKIINWPGNRYGADERTAIQKYIVSEATDVIVTFDNSTTDALLDALTNLGHNARVYCVSTSNKAVYNLYSRGVNMLEYTDEFSMGYLAAMHALDHTYASGRYAHRQIEYRMVRKENMYDEDNQTLLFPFVD